MLSLECVFDIPLAWGCLLSGTVPATSILCNLIASTNFSRSGSLFEAESVESILDVYKAMSHLDHVSQADAATVTVKMQNPSALRHNEFSIPTKNSKQPLDAARRLNVCCQLSCYLFWKKLRAHLYQKVEMENVEEIKLLLEILTDVDPSFWISNAPEAFTWIIFTGAAASMNEKTREAFIHLGGTVITAIDSEDLLLGTQGWRYFRLLQNLGSSTLSVP
jgi:hypothetical protein